VEPTRKKWLEAGWHGGRLGFLSLSLLFLFFSRAYKQLEVVILTPLSLQTTTLSICRFLFLDFYSKIIHTLS
jgi:hypothetical protein